MRRALIAANWKMNKSAAETAEFLNELKEKGVPDDRDVLICPPFTVLNEALTTIADSSILLGAQNMHYEDSGAYTGDISPLMLKDFNCTYVILGHSERRHIFGENDEFINKKVLAALKHEITPILCVGELKEQREAGKTQDVITEQLNVGLHGVDDILKVVIAYEPVWAISRGDPNHKAATAEDAEEVHLFIRNLLKKRYGDSAAEVRIIYGGSAKPENIRELMEKQDIDGALVGGASLDVVKFRKVIEFDK